MGFDLGDETFFLGSALLPSSFKVIVSFLRVLEQIQLEIFLFECF